MPQSNFLLTINTNVRPDDNADSRQLADKLADAIKTLFTKENVDSALKYLDGDLMDIKTVYVKFATEIGKNKKGGRIHTHAKIEIDHNAKIQLNSAGIQAFIAKEMDDPRVQHPYVNIKYFRNKNNIDKYIEKDREM